MFLSSALFVHFFELWVYPELLLHRGDGWIKQLRGGVCRPLITVSLFFSETFPRATRAYCTNREIFQRVMWALSLHSSCFFFLSFFLSTSSLPAEEQCESRPVQWRRPHRLTSGETDTLARNRDSLKSQARVRRKVSDNNLLQRYRMILDKLFQKKGFVSRRK